VVSAAPGGTLGVAVFLTNNNGSPAIIDGSTTVIGTAVNFLGDGFRDIFLRELSGQVVVVSEAPGGTLGVAVFLTNTGGSLAIVDRSTTVIGTAVNFLGDGYRDIFLRELSGQIVVVSEAPGGTLGVAVFLTNNNGSPAIVDGSTAVIGTAVNFLGDGYRDIFLREASGQVAVVSAAPGGTLGVAVFLTDGGAPFGIAASSSIVSTGTDAVTNRQEFVLQLFNGQTQIYDYSGEGVVALQ